MNYASDLHAPFLQGGGEPTGIVPALITTN